MYQNKKYFSIFYIFIFSFKCHINWLINKITCFKSHEINKKLFNIFPLIYIINIPLIINIKYKGVYKKETNITQLSFSHMGKETKKIKPSICLRFVSEYIQITVMFW